MLAILHLLSSSNAGEGCAKVGSLFEYEYESFDDHAYKTDKHLCDDS
jgi:hypothetical protein